jgi:peptide/nickel transport system permease protein
MLWLTLRRAALAIPTLVGVVIVTFLLTRALPGDPAAYFAGPAASQAAVEEVRRALGLDRPLIEQFGRYVTDLVSGNLGASLTTGQPVLAEIAARLPASAELTLAGLLVAVLVAVPLGIVAALRPNAWPDHLCRVVSTAGVSLPVFFSALLFVYVFYYRLGWAPAPLGRLDVFFSAPETVTGFYLVDSLIAGDLETFRAALASLVLPGPDARLLRPGPDRPHDPRLHAGRARRRLRAHRARERPCRLDDRCRLRFPQRGAARHHHAGNGVFLPARRERARREGLRLARHRLLRRGGADRRRLCPVQGFVLAMAILYVLLNLTIDIVYGLVDPRVRIEG